MLLERPRGRVERILRRLIALGNRYFQIESLYRFNAKFSQRWEPRYLIYETVLVLPRTGVAAVKVSCRHCARDRTRAGDELFLA